MGRGRTGIMKLLLETWRRLLEGDVIQFPQKPKISEANTDVSAKINVV